MLVNIAARKHRARLRSGRKALCRSSSVEEIPDRGPVQDHVAAVTFTADTRVRGVDAAHERVPRSGKLERAESVSGKVDHG